MPIRFLRWSFFMGLLVFCIAVYLLVAKALHENPSALTMVKSLELPTPRGESSVGRRLLYWKDASRERDLAAWVFYPTTASHAPSETVLPVAWSTLYRPDAVKRFGEAAGASLTEAHTHAQLDAPLSQRTTKFPVLIFSPGFGWLPTSYSTILEDLASHGYAVLALAPPKLSPVVCFPDGRTVQGVGDVDRLYLQTSEDIHSALTWLEQLNTDSNSPLRGRLELKRVGVFGHSLGGAAAILAGARDNRIKASANLDGDFAQETINARPSQPILYLTTEPLNQSDGFMTRWLKDRSALRRERAWSLVKEHAPSSIRIRVQGMCHTNFQDVSLLAPNSIPAEKRLNVLGPIDGARGLHITGEVLRAFFDRHILEDASADILKPLKSFPEVRLETSGAP